MAVDPGDYNPPITAESAARLAPLEIGYDDFGPAFPIGTHRASPALATSGTVQPEDPSSMLDVP